MAYVAKDYSKLIGMSGFSEDILKNHFTLYQGYVTNTNRLIEILEKMLADGNTSTPEYAELKRRLGWEFNGMRLHELITSAAIAVLTSLANCTRILPLYLVVTKLGKRTSEQLVPCVA